MMPSGWVAPAVLVGIATLVVLAVAYGVNLMGVREWLRENRRQARVHLAARVYALLWYSAMTDRYRGERMRRGDKTALRLLGWVEPRIMPGPDHQINPRTAQFPEPTDSLSAVLVLVDEHCRRWAGKKRRRAAHRKPKETVTEERAVSQSGRNLHPAIVEVGVALERCLLDCKPYLWQAGSPRPGSPWSGDLQEERPSSADPKIPILHAHPQLAGYWYGVAGADAMLGVQACLGSDSLYSAGALSRVAMEAFAWGSWIWEPALPLDNRIMRGLLCRKHEAKQLIRNYNKHINANQGPSGSRLLTREDEESAVQLVEHWEQWRTTLMSDIETVESLPGNASSESRPSSFTELVTATLDALVGKPGAGQGRYGLHSGLVHLGEGSIGIRLPLDMPSDFAEHPNIELDRFMPVIREAVLVMRLYLQRLAECWGLDSPDERLQPLMDAIIEASDQPEGTLLFAPAN